MIKPNRYKILVVGAGPAGLAFALECAAKGTQVRVIERRTERLHIGKATGVLLGLLRKAAPVCKVVLPANFGGVVSPFNS